MNLDTLTDLQQGERQHKHCWRTRKALTPQFSDELLWTGAQSQPTLSLWLLPISFPKNQSVVLLIGQNHFLWLFLGRLILNNATFDRPSSMEHEELMPGKKKKHAIPTHPKKKEIPITYTIVPTPLSSLSPVFNTACVSVSKHCCDCGFLSVRLLSYCWQRHESLTASFSAAL